MPMQNQVDEIAVRQMVSALQRTDADCDSAMRAVNSATSYLNSVWQGEAANRYRSALHDWTEGLIRVQRGVRELNDAMATYHQSAGQVESDNTTSASWT